MSTVYLAIQISVGRVVALKVMSPTLNGDPAFSERFQREANIVGQLSHPNIVSIYDIGQHDSLNYIAMDYLPGGSVHDRMMTGLTAEEALRVTREIASALDHAHEKGYIHRDIKPENILFRADHSAVLSDFGVAKGIIGVSRMTNVGQVVGTPHYMSPEQTRGKPVDGRSDLYSLGVVFYEMLTGSVPFQGEDAVAIAIKHLSAPVPRLPVHYQGYQKIVDRLLEKDPDQRFQSGRELVIAIEMLEAPGRGGYITTANPTELSTLALLKALVAATGTALNRQLGKALHLRWTPQRGVYQHPETRVTEILITGLSEDERATAVSTRVHQATHLQLVHNPRRRLLSRIVLGGVMLGIIGMGVKALINDDDTALAPVANAEHQSSARASASSAKSSGTVTPISALPAAVALDQSAGVPAASDAAASQAASSVAGVPPLIKAEAKPRFALTVDTIPSNARVRIMNIPDRYQHGILLEPGPYHIEVSHPGFKTRYEWIEITDKNFQPSYILERVIPPSTNFVSNLGGSLRGPEMVRIPVGSFLMGNKNDSTCIPVHNVVISKPFAISKYEVSFDEYDLFAKATDRALPGDNRWGRGNRPVINVSWEDARAYARWLSKMSGETYRLPTESEWEYVARAGSRTLYWWGDNDREAMDRANCRRGCYSAYSGLFGSRTAPVGSYPANDFGVYDVAGNVAEWVQDCYADNYNNKPKDGRAYETSQCTRRVVRGGSSKNNVEQIASHVRDAYPPEIYEENLGFRVVMELK